MAFSPDGRLLATQGGAPDWNLTLWVWEKSKIAASTKTTNQNGSAIHQVCRHFTGPCPCRMPVGWAPVQGQPVWRLAHCPRLQEVMHEMLVSWQASRQAQPSSPVPII